MSELKVIDVDRMADVRSLSGQFYRKSEADKYINLLKDKANYNEFAYKLKSEELADTCRFYEDELRHQKYRRCLAMANWCNDRYILDDCLYELGKIGFYKRWEKRWMELAEKFEEVK